MKILINKFVICILGIFFTSIAISQTDEDDSLSINTINDYSKEYKLESRLYIKRQGKKKKVRVKEGALINCQLMDYSYTGVSTLKIIADDGIYLAPYQIQTDSLVTKRKKTEVLVFSTDTIIFVKYIDILKFNFRNKVKNQMDGAGMLLFTGSELIFTPLILTPFIYGSVENVPSKIIAGFLSAGIPFISAGIIWKLILRKFRSFPMQEYEFYLVKKTD